MKTKTYLFIAFRIIMLFGIAMAATFLPEQLRDFFNDVNTPKNSAFGVDEEWTWGVRHYWFYWMMFCLFVLSVIDIIISIYRKIGKWEN